MGTATLERPPATVTQLGFTWSCRAGECDAKGHDRDEYTAHMRGHGKRAMGGTKPIRLRKGAPAATLPKLPLGDPCAVIEWTETRRAPGTCECGHGPDFHGPDWITDTEGTWEAVGKGRRKRQRYIPPVGHETDPGCTECACTTPDYEIDPVITEARRSGQFWATGPYAGTVWVLPHEPAPWEDGPARPVALRITDGEYSPCSHDSGNAVRQAENVRQRGVFHVITGLDGGPLVGYCRVAARTVHTDPECAAAEGWRESDRRPHDMWRVVDTLTRRTKAEDGITLCPRCVLLEPSEDAPQAIESSTERADTEPATETASPTAPSIAAEVPPEQAKHDITGDEMGETMDTATACKHPARWAAGSTRTPCRDCPGDPAEPARDARMDAARERAAERIDRARQRIGAGMNTGAPGAGVATREPDAITPTIVSAPARRQRPDAAELLRQVLEQMGLLLCEYIQFPSRAAVVAVVLWIAHAAARGADKKLIWRATARLLLTSAQNGSGKSTLMDLIAGLLLSRVGRLVKVTPAGLAGILNELNDVALPDDAQLIFGTTGSAAKDLQAVLLGSYSKKGSWVTGKSTVSVKPVYGPVVIAGKDQLITVQRDKLTDLLARSVIIRMERPSQYMPQPDDETDAKCEMIGKALAAVMGALETPLLQAVKELDREARGQEITEGDGGRTAQIFRQLRAVARVAGGMWPAAMDEAAEELIADAGDLITVEDMLKSLASDMDPGDAPAGSVASGPSFWDQMEGMQR